MIQRWFYLFAIFIKIFCSKHITYLYLFLFPFFQEHSFEVSLFAELFNEMLMRDFGFRIYRSLYEAAEKVKEEEKEKVCSVEFLKVWWKFIEWRQFWPNIFFLQERKKKEEKEKKEKEEKEKTQKDKESSEEKEGSEKDGEIEKMEDDTSEQDASQVQ